MCGISAIIKSNRDIKDLLSPITHRGEQEYFNESKIFEMGSLGMNRLAIVDREQAVQPVVSEDGKYAIVFNGEIYNHKDLKIELESLGHRLDLDSDTEVLLHAYIAWGEDMFEKMHGMYAFIIFNTEEETYFIARDRMGIKPLYFADGNNGGRYFASEIKSLTHLDDVIEVNLFPPASYMKDGEIKQYWSPGTNLIEDSEEVIISKLRILLDEAVKRRVDTDLPIGLYFSGGVDSAAILATANKYHDDVTAIIIGNAESEDKQVAVRFCEENNLKYIVKSPPTEQELVESVPGTIRMTESFEPNMIRQSTISYYIAQAGAELGVKVILCGEGADELFAGYPEFLALENHQIRDKSVAFLRDLHRTQLQRVDRTSMHFTTEVRVPFLDKDVIDYVLSIPSEYKVRDGVSKYILRKVVEDRLPEYVYNRKKVVLSEGAGYGGNQKEEGLFYEKAQELISDLELKEIKEEYPDWNIDNKEEALYFQHYLKNNYGKAVFNQMRVTANAINTND